MDLQYTRVSSLWCLYQELIHVCYARACFSYVDRKILLNKKLVNEGYTLEKLFYGRYNDTCIL